MTGRASVQSCQVSAVQDELAGAPHPLMLARHHFLAHGVVPAGVPLAILRSWQRSAAHGLDPANALAEEAVSRTELREVLERNQDLVQAAWGEIETLCRDTEAAGGIVVLTDPDGVILVRAGSTSFAEQADRIALRPGMRWSEPVVGTNAIGTALFERREISVFGAEHFLAPHSVLSCSATPVFGPRGEIVGVLDLSSSAQLPHGYTLALVRRAAEQIERLLFQRAFSTQEQMHLHSNPYLLGSPHEGLLAFDGDRLVGANRNAVSLLGLAWSAIGSVRFDQLFSVQQASIQRNASSDECLVQTMRGSTLFARLQQPPRSRPPIPQAAPPGDVTPRPIPPGGGPELPAREALERLLTNVPPGQLRTRRLKPGHLLYGAEEANEGRPCIVVVRSGRLRCFISFEGKELTLFMLEAGDAILLHPQSILEAKKSCDVAIMRQSTFRALASNDPNLGLSMMSAVEWMLQKSIRIIEEMAFHGVKHRLVRVLCETADRDGRHTEHGTVIDIAPNGEDLAMQVGATRQSVSTVIAGLIRAGVIQRMGSCAIVVPSLERLKAEVQTPG
ncbi:GAF domain-containing protein [Rhodovastum atsumiense]|uniref:Helix-turn-helix domain-containing protein n=1 Tax=Rhodovastum atsumiense TaxID=504468 RepID=A0A5M6IV73_9PROT|nr:GAF domain-containing protein [Rhodovastum atsumiense]KAA5612206.1 helix-turn-helix domain-containing protein [Rhodovastum atsumiense]